MSTRKETFEVRKRVFLILCASVVFMVLRFERETSKTLTQQKIDLSILDLPAIGDAGTEPMEEEQTEERKRAYRQKDLVLKVSNELSMQPEFLLESQTAVSEAFQWLAAEDSMELDAESPNLIQRLVLATLYVALDGEEWNFSGFLDDSVHECVWFSQGKGVKDCDENEDITSLALVDSNLSGSLPAELRYLSQLTNLDLRRNEIRGRIPHRLGELVNLNYLALGANHLSGSVPETLQHLESLEQLLLEDNQLIGSIAPEVCELFESGALVNMWSDCGRTDLECDCCTVCCSTPSDCGPRSSTGSDRPWEKFDSENEPQPLNIFEEAALLRQGEIPFQ
mmetsp:Transcript_4811/g.6721  ORF Transcript_4811/g.6721 Transcript_4811/m.6721 type:complete len:338 (-) Transcript_4811:45-1058(-)